jgi:hypothetical protein
MSIIHSRFPELPAVGLRACRRQDGGMTPSWCPPPIDGEDDSPSAPLLPQSLFRRVA